MNSNVPIGNQERREIHKADEELLVDSAKEGNEQAFAALWSRCSVMNERLQFVARRLAGEPMARTEQIRYRERKRAS